MRIKHVDAISSAFTLRLEACGGSGAGTTAADSSSSGTKAVVSAAGALVGVVMPTKSFERWIADGNNV